MYFISYRFTYGKRRIKELGKNLRCGLDTDDFAFAFFFSCLLHCSWDMNSAFRFMNSNPHCSCTWITLCRRYCALFTGLTATLFRKNIKNWSHGTIYTFKNYFATIFFSFQFQFSVFSYIQTNPKSKRSIEKCLQLELRI